MKQLITFTRNNPDTGSGDSITIKVFCSSFDPREIDQLEEYLKQNYSFGIETEFVMEDSFARKG